MKNKHEVLVCFVVFAAKKIYFYKLLMSFAMKNVYLHPETDVLEMLPESRILTLSNPNKSVSGSGTGSNMDDADYSQNPF